MLLRRNQLAAVASVIVLVLGTAACGGSDDPSPAAEGASGDKTSSSSDGDLTTANFTETLVAAQKKARTSHLEMTIEAGGQTITATGDQLIGETLEENSASMTMDYGSLGLGEAKVVIVDGKFFMNFGKVTGGKYATADLTNPSDPLTQQLGPMLDQLDTTKQIESLSAAVTSVEKKGAPEQIDGVDAQPYELVVDTSKMDAFDALPPESRSLIPDSLTYTMFLGSDGLLRRMTYGFSGTTGTVEFTKWGEPVTIEAPSPDEVSDQDLGSLLRGAAAA